MKGKKLIAAVLAGGMACTLAACTRSEGRGDGSGDYVKEFTQKVAGVDPDTVMFTVGGEEVTAEYYFYWLASDCMDLINTYQQNTGMQLDLDEQVEEGMSAAQYLKDDARELAAAYVVLEQQAAANGASLTEDQQTDWAEYKAEYIEGSGEEAFGRLLRQWGLSEPMFDRIGMVTTYLVGNVMEVMTAAPDPEEEEAYIAENDLLRAKHILILTAVEGEDGTVSLSTGGSPLNEDGTPFTGTAQEFNDAAREKAEGLLAQLAAADAPLSLFTQLMNQYSEDTGLANNPDGYTFGAGEMVAPFEEAVRALEYDEYTTQLVQSTFGYHIILRLRPEIGETLRLNQMQGLMEEWSRSECQTTAAFDQLDVKSFYAAYLEYTQSLQDQEG